MKISTRFLSLSAIAAVAFGVSAQTPTTPPAFTIDPADVAVIFAADQDTYFEVAKDSQGNPANSWAPVKWGQTTVVSEDECGDGAALRIDNLDFLPMQFAATLDLSEYRYVHMDFWAQKDDQMCVKFQNWWPGETFVTEIFDLKGGEWKSLDIDLDQPDFTWSKKNEIPQHCVNVVQFAGERLPNDFDHAAAIYVTNIIAHNGSDTGVDNVMVDNKTKSGVRYNIMGQPVDASFKGIVICDGKKFIQR